MSVNRINMLTGDLTPIADLVQFEIPPTADAQIAGRIIQYIGATTATYTNGSFYKCVETETAGTYGWEELPFGGDAVEWVTALPVAPDIKSVIYGVGSPDGEFIDETERQISPIVEESDIDDVSISVEASGEIVVAPLNNVEWMQNDGSNHFRPVAGANVKVTIDSMGISDETLIVIDNTNVFTEESGRVSFSASDTINITKYVYGHYVDSLDGETRIARQQYTDIYRTANVNTFVKINVADEYERFTSYNVVTRTLVTSGGTYTLETTDTLTFATDTAIVQFYAGNKTEQYTVLISGEESKAVIWTSILPISDIENVIYGVIQEDEYINTDVCAVEPVTNTTSYSSVSRFDTDINGALSTSDLDTLDYLESDGNGVYTPVSGATVEISEWVDDYFTVVSIDCGDGTSATEVVTVEAGTKYLRMDSEALFRRVTNTYTVADLDNETRISHDGDATYNANGEVYVTYNGLTAGDYEVFVSYNVNTRVLTRADNTYTLETSDTLTFADKITGNTLFYAGNADKQTTTLINTPHQDSDAIVWVSARPLTNIKNVVYGVIRAGEDPQFYAGNESLQTTTLISSSDTSVIIEDVAVLPTGTDIEDHFYRIEGTDETEYYAGYSSETKTERIALFDDIPEEVPHWSGTLAEYEAQKDNIEDGTYVSLTDDIDSTYESGDYSTNEVNTGKRWIDGKPIYRKVFVGNAILQDPGAAVGQRCVYHAVSDNSISYDHIINYSGYYDWVRWAGTANEDILEMQLTGTNVSATLQAQSGSTCMIIKEKGSLSPSTTDVNGLYFGICVISDGNNPTTMSFALIVEYTKND